MHTIALVMTVVKDTARLRLSIMIGVEEYILLLTTILMLIEILESFPMDFGEVSEELFG